MNEVLTPAQALLQRLEKPYQETDYMKAVDELNRRLLGRAGGLGIAEFTSALKVTGQMLEGSIAGANDAVQEA